MFRPGSSPSPVLPAPAPRYWRPFDTPPPPDSAPPAPAFTPPSTIGNPAILVTPAHPEAGVSGSQQASALAARCSRGDIEQIAAGDSTLCELMGQRPSALTRLQLEANTLRARSLIGDLAPLRIALAQRTCRTLHTLLTLPDGPGEIDCTWLRTCIQHAGLPLLLQGLRAGELTEPQRRYLATALANAGGHPNSLRSRLDWSTELHRSKPEDRSALLDRLLPVPLADAVLEAKAALERAKLDLEQANAAPLQAQRGEQVALHAATLNTRKAVARHHANMVNRRFDYPQNYPAWKVLAGRNQTDARVKMLVELAKIRPRQGLPGVQLP